MTQTTRRKRNMTLISETVNKYYFGATKVIKKVEEDDNSFLVETKQVYFIGLKVFQSSTCRKRSIRESVIQAWGGKLQ